MSRAVLAKLGEEIAEVEAEIADGSAQTLSGEVGDLLFAAVNLARHLKVDPEAALRGANAKFERRFAHIESRLAERGRTPESASLDEMESLWVEAKGSRRSGGVSDKNDAVSAIRDRLKHAAFTARRPPSEAPLDPFDLVRRNAHGEAHTGLFVAPTHDLGVFVEPMQSLPVAASSVSSTSGRPRANRSSIASEAIDPLPGRRRDRERRRPLRFSS